MTQDFLSQILSAGFREAGAVGEIDVLGVEVDVVTVDDGGAVNADLLLRDVRLGSSAQR